MSGHESLDPGTTRSFQHYEIFLRADDGQPWELGRGAMGVTYKALDTNLRAPVALKVIHARHSAQPEARARFLREARIAARLRHPNIASVFHYGTMSAPAPAPLPTLELLAGDESPPTCFYAMELVEGETLYSRLRRTGPLPPAEAVEIALGIAAALEAAEKRGLIHRDLKPANVMLAADAEGAAAVKVIDFGLAKAVRATDAGELDEAGADGGPSTRGAFLGTLRFASPEQFDGRPLDSRADIYALGATLWTLLTGEPPHGGHTPAEVHDHQLHRPLPVARLADARVPAPLVALLERMLAPDPAARPASVRALREELVACRARLQRRPARWLPRAAFALAAGVLAIAAAAWGYRAVAPVPTIPVAPVPGTSRAAPVREQASLAVLPFEDRSPAGGDRDYLSAGIPEEILTRLGKLASLRVVAGSRIDPAAPDPVATGRRLGVAYLLRGSVQSLGETVRIRVLLLDAANDGAQLWAETYTRRRDDIFAVETEVAHAVADQIGARFAGRVETTRADDTVPTENPAAYDAYLRGVAVTLDPIQQTATLQRAERYFAEAVRLDPRFALAWARLAAVRLRGYESGWLDPTPALLDDIRDAVEHTRQLAPDTGETLLVEGYFQRVCLHDADAAIRSYERARHLLPNSPLVLRHLALIARDRGRWEEALALLEDACRLDPRNPRLLTERAIILVCQRRLAESLRAYDAVLNVLPDHPNTLAAQAEVFMALGDLPAAERLFGRVRPASADYNFLYQETTLAWLQRQPGRVIPALKNALAQPDALKPTSAASLAVLLGRSELLAGEREEGLATLRAAREQLEIHRRDQPDNAFLLTDLARACAALGDHDAALAAAERACALVPTARDRMIGPSMEDVLAEVCALVGERERAIALLERLTQTNYFGSITNPPLTAATLRHYPAFDSLHGDPRFERLCADPAPAPRP